MEESSLLLVFRIVVFLSITDIHNIQLQTVPDPCPDITPSITIADMCTTNYATEEDINGGTTIDSVTLRVMAQQHGCECEVTLQNQTSTYTIYMRKYDLLSSAAPVHDVCGLAIDIDHNIQYNIQETKDPIECTKGINTRSILLSKNEILTLRSRIIGGNFTRGYCMQLFRHHTVGENQRLQISCSQPLTTLQMTDGTTIYATIPENVNVNLPVIVAATIGWCLTVLFAITTFYMYRKRNTPTLDTAIGQHVNLQYEDLRASRISSCYNEVDISTISNAEQHDRI